MKTTREETRFETREELMRIIKDRELYEESHKKTDYVYIPKLTLSQFMDEHPRLCVSAIVPLALIIISMIMQ